MYVRTYVGLGIRGGGGGGLDRVRMYADDGERMKDESGNVAAYAMVESGRLI